MKKAIIDFDSGVYGVASAVDGRHYAYQSERWDLKKVAEKAMERKGVDPSLLVFGTEPEEWDTVKRTMDRYVNDFIGKLPDQFNYEFYVKGGGNFRDKVATILPYKMGRGPGPHWRKAINSYMVTEHGAKMVYKVEVDDALGILAAEDTVLVHIDKDIEQVPGLHFNPSTREEYTIDEAEGLRRVYKQLLIGDSTDAILGLHGVGAKSTHVKKLWSMDKEEEMFEHVGHLYSQRFGTYAPLFLREFMMLAWMMRDDQVLYHWMEVLLDQKDTEFYMNPYNTVEIR